MPTDAEREDLLARLREVDACAISDALDGLGLPGVVHELTCLSGPLLHIRGIVTTVKVGPRQDDAARPHLGTGAIMSSGPGDVIVIDNGGRVGVSSWGGLLSLAAFERGVEGVVVDGACRDVAEAAELGFAVFARAAVPTSARGRIVEEATAVSIRVGDVKVGSGDLVVADASGVAFVARRNAQAVLAAAQQVTKKEAAMAAAVRSGKSIIEIMHDRSFDRPSEEQR